MPDKRSLEEMLALRSRIREGRPLIHCITNPIAINDCANVLLAIGARPIMAEHPREVAEITGAAQALALNLGSITDARMESMMLAASTAKACEVPFLVDLVGVGCSSLRRTYARDLIGAHPPQVIKGNLSEIRAFCGLQNAASGIDGGEEAGSLTEQAVMLSKLSMDTGAVILATGKVDLIADGDSVHSIANGSEMLSCVTGTGCMLGVLAAAFLAEGDPVEAAILASLLLAISGELAALETNAPGSFRTALIDTIYRIGDGDILKRARFQTVKGGDRS